MSALRSLTGRVIVVLALAALIPTVAIGALAFDRTRDDLEREVVRGNLALVRALGAGLDATLQDARRAVEIAAATWADGRATATAVDEADRRATARLLGRLDRDVPVLSRLVIVDGNGNAVAGDALPEGVDLEARSFGGYVGDAIFVDGHPRVPLVVQARSRTGELVGFFVLADRTFLVIQPHGGDHVQFMKAGIMEVPDAFIVSKGDLDEAATATFHALGASLRLAAPGASDRPIYRTSALTGAGVAELGAAIAAVPSGGLDARAPYYFERWVATEYGRAGLRRLAGLAPTTAAYLAAHGGLDGAQQAFAQIS
jgi:hypothetical protein